jgi:hypothetical protein
MKTNTFTSMGSLHPVLFFAVIYIVALFFSIFICSSLFYSCNASSVKVGEEKLRPVINPAGQQAPVSGTTVAMR